MSVPMEMLHCEACGAESVRRQGNRIIITDVGEDEYGNHVGDHTVVIDLLPSSRCEFRCGCGHVQFDEFDPRFA